MLGFLALFILVPAVELYLLIAVGTQIGAAWTFGLILLTGFLGASLVRRQGLGVYRRIQEESARGRLPALELVEGLVLLLAGALLITPGLLTDTVGFLALVPALRQRAARALARRAVIGGTGAVFRVQVGGDPFVGGPFDASRPSGARGAPSGPFRDRPTGSTRGPVVDVDARPISEDSEPRAPRQSAE